ncbi:MAG: hypothetical protein AAB512_02265 [Patescibacteria group bacterium]
MPQSKRNLYIIAAVSLLLIFVVIYSLFIFQKQQKQIKVNDTPAEIKQITDVDMSKRPFITLTPTANGSEIIISIENMQEFENIEYELTYLADNPQIPNEKIERGATGTDINTKDEKYKKSILLGTASKGAASPDRGITDGKLTLHLFKGAIEYQSESKWQLLQVGLTTKEIISDDGNFVIKLPPFTKDYYAILADTVGIPPKGEFDVNKVQLPVYGVFSTAPKFPKKGSLSIKTDKQDPKLFVYNHQDSIWGNQDATREGDTLTSQIEFFSTFVVVSSK